MPKCRRRPPEGGKVLILLIYPARRPFAQTAPRLDLLISSLEHQLRLFWAAILGSALLEIVPKRAGSRIQPNLTLENLTFFSVGDDYRELAENTEVLNHGALNQVPKAFLDAVERQGPDQGFSQWLHGWGKRLAPPKAHDQVQEVPRSHSDHR
jgi:hypothetical protein